MVKIFAFGVILIILLTGFKLHGQDKNVTKSNQQWVQYYNQTRFSEKWTLLVDGGYRWKNEFHSSHQYLIRAGAGYEISPGITVAAGLGHWGTYSEAGVSLNEVRPHQEISMKNPGKLGLSQRIRIEERFLETTSRSDEQFSRFNWRFRYFIGISIPVVKEFGKQNQMALQINVGDEIFINAGKDIVYNVFDQNRILLGPSFQLNPELTFSLTYQGNFAAFNLPSQYAYTHIMWFAIRHQLDLTKTP